MPASTRRLPTSAGRARCSTWGHDGFPEEYGGAAWVMYGHTNDADLDAEGWPRPRVVGRTIGLDTIAHGVLTAVALPGPIVFQSARYEYAIRRRG